MNGDGYSREEVRWSAAEKKIPGSALRMASWSAAIRANAKKMLATASAPSDMWKVHDYLSVQRRATDKIYDYRYSVLLTVFARLLKEKRKLNVADLAGLQESEIEKIEEWVTFWHSRG